MLERGKKSYKKKKKKGIGLRNNKLFFGFFGVFFALIIFLGATRAWSSYTEWVTNHIQALTPTKEALKIKVTEDFIQKSIVNFSSEGIEKSVKVKNYSQDNALIRVKFLESIAPFEVNLEAGEDKGNANLKTYALGVSNPVMTQEDTASWVSGNLYKTTKQNGAGVALYYKATNETVIDKLYKGEEDRKNNPATPAPLKIFKWQLNPAVKTAPDNTATPYWVFDAATGYFYYSQVLEGETTTAIDLLQRVLFTDPSIPNKYKNALYDIQVVAEGVSPTEANVKSWTADTAILDMYKKDVNFGKE